MNRLVRKSIPFAAAGLLGLSLLAGCKSKEDAAVDQAKTQAASTGQPQQVQYIDANGDTVTTTVQPPVAGQPQQVSTQITSPPPGPRPKQTKPVVAPLGAAPVAPGQSNTLAGNSTPASGPYDTSSGAPAPAAGTNPQPATARANFSVPAGTQLAVRVNQHISVKSAHAGDHFSGEIVEPVTVDGNVVIPRGTPVGGRIDAAHKRGHFKGASVLELRLTSMELNGNQYALQTNDNIRTKKGKGKRTAGWIGGMGGAGALIGGLAGGGAGLAIGAASGAGAGTLIAGTTGNRDIDIPAESIVRFRLADTVYIR